MTLRDLMRRDLVMLEPYPPPLPLDEIEQRIGRRIVKLDANENPYGASPHVAEALAACRPERYQDADCTELRRELGAYLSVEPERIACSSGGDEMLDLLCRLFLNPGDEVVDCTPSFVMYALSTAYNHGTVLRVPRGSGFEVDVAGIERVLSSRTRIIFLCSPNNPTGNSTPLADIRHVLEMDRMVVLDEAYAEFAGRTLVNLTHEYPNLVVLRTFSKWAALAGIRLGYAVMDPLVVQEMRKIKSPYTVNAAAQAAGVASLRDREYLLENVRRIVAERDRLLERLAGLPVGTVYPSETNFLYWTTGFPDGPRARPLRDALTWRGVLVRALEDPVEALRFSVGTPDESDRLMEALQEAIGDCAG